MGTLQGHARQVLASGRRPRRTHRRPRVPASLRVAELSTTTDTAPASDGLKALHRASAAVVGLALGEIVGALAAIAFGSDGDIPLLWALGGGVVGAVAGAVWPHRLSPKVTPGPSIVPGRPVPLLALGYVFADKLGRTTVKALWLGVSIALGAPLAAEGVYAVLGQHPSDRVVGSLLIVGYLAAILCATLLPAFLLDERTRRALAVMSWHGAREFERDLGSKRAAAKFPVTPDAARAWLEKDVRWDAIRPLDVEAMVIAGDLEAARDAVGRLPVTTPRERFVRVDLEAGVRYQATGDMDRSAVRDALAAIPPGIEHVEAAAAIAVTDARMRLPDGDWLEPLLAVRDAIPESDARILLRDDGWVRLTIVLASLWPILLPLLGLAVLTAVLP